MIAGGEFVSKSGQIRIPLGLSSGGSSATVVAGIRPENLALVDGGMTTRADVIYS